MNILLHFLIAYFAVEIAIGNAWSYVIYIFIFSVILDFDHIGYILREKGKIRHKKFGYESRTRFHELYGLTLISVVLSVLFFFVNFVLVQVVALSFVMHYAVDFLVGKSRPFYPYSNKDVFLHLCPDRYRAPVEVILTIVLLVVFWFSIQSLVL